MNAATNCGGERPACLADAARIKTGYDDNLRLPSPGGGLPSPAAEPHPLDPIGRTRVGTVIRRNGEHLSPGSLLDVSYLPVA